MKRPDINSAILSRVKNQTIADQLIALNRAEKLRYDYNALNRVSATLKTKLRSVVETHEKYKSAYFWTPNTNAAGRRRAENRFRTHNPEFSVLTKDGLLKIEFSYSESCRNVYYSLRVTLNGQKKTIAAIKKLIK